MITVTTALAADIASFAPCRISGTADRDRYRTDGTLIQDNITAWANSGGKLAISIADEKDYEVGDSVVIAGGTGDLSNYNGRHNIQLTGTGQLIMATDWTGGTTAAVGTVTRANDNLMVRADVYKGADLLGSVYTMPVNQAFTVDVSDILKTGHSSIFTLTAGAVATTGAAFAYTVKLFEQYQAANFGTVSEETVAEEQTGTAHRTTSVTGIDTTTILNSNFQAGGKLLIHALNDQGSTLAIRFTASTGAQTTVAVTRVNKHIAACYEIPAGAKWVEVEVRETDFGVNYATLTVRVPAQVCTKRLYYLNRIGGYASVELVEWEDFNATDKVWRFPTKSYLIREAKTVREARQNAAYYDGLVDSPEIYDETGAQVYIREDRLQTYGNDVQLSVTIEYDINNMV